VLGTGGHLEAHDDLFESLSRVIHLALDTDINKEEKFLEFYKKKVERELQ
jgi:hypothetical protein